jgi:hypothetical protein
MGDREATCKTLESWGFARVRLFPLPTEPSEPHESKTGVKRRSRTTFVGDLLRRFVQGDRDAFESLFGRFEVEVYRWTLNIVPPQRSAEYGVA